MTVEHPASGMELQLGKPQLYVDQYDAALLQPIPRHLSRQHLSVANFSGCDIWTAYELSWLDSQGKPQVATAEFSFPANSPNIIESKSFKYYLNSFNQTVFASAVDVQDRLQQDLALASGAAVEIRLFPTGQVLSAVKELSEFLIVDALPLADVVYTPDAGLLRVAADVVIESQILCSHLLKSNCPVTGQPDWASVWVGYSGPQIVPESFLAYVVSYRQHQDFHENCVEQMFADIKTQCQPADLWVYARYTRRGGLDINPFRSSMAMEPPAVRGFRQ